MKSINEPITVDARNGVPSRFWWGRRTYRTRKLLDYWILQTRWWGCEERRIYFRLLTDGGVMEVYRAVSGRSAAPSREELVRPEEEGSSRRDIVRSEEEGSARREAVRSKEEGSARRERPPLPMEGDTHTRERRRTDAVYRPDVRWGKACRSDGVSSDASSRGFFSAGSPPGDAPPSGSAPGSPPGGSRPSGSSPTTHWVLSKIVD